MTGGRRRGRLVGELVVISGNSNRTFIAVMILKLNHMLKLKQGGELVG